jgi:hypothetical protein
MALMVKTSISYQKNKRDSSYIWNLFLLCKKSIPDAILNPRYSSPAYQYIEGGDFRVPLIGVGIAHLPN